MSSLLHRVCRVSAIAAVVLCGARLLASDAADFPAWKIQAIWPELWKTGASETREPVLDPLSEEQVMKELVGRWSASFGVTPDRIVVSLGTNRQVVASGIKDDKAWEKRGEWTVVSNKLVLFLEKDSLPGFIFRTGGKTVIFDPWATNMMSELRKEISAGEFWSAAARGELYETHTFPDRPAIEIQIRGFNDSSFDAYLVDGNERRLICRSLAELKSYFNMTTNPHRRKYEGKCVTTKGRVQMYEVFWSTNGKRVAVAFQGYFVAGYDRESARTLQLTDYKDSKPYPQYDYVKCDAEIEAFVNESR